MECDVSASTVLSRMVLHARRGTGVTGGCGCELVCVDPNGAPVLTCGAPCDKPKRRTSACDCLRWRVCGPVWVSTSTHLQLCDAGLQVLDLCCALVQLLLQLLCRILVGLEGLQLEPHLLALLRLVLLQLLQAFKGLAQVQGCEQMGECCRLQARWFRGAGYCSGQA